MNHLYIVKEPPAISKSSQSSSEENPRHREPSMHESTNNITYETYLSFSLNPKCIAFYEEPKLLLT